MDFFPTNVNLTIHLEDKTSLTDKNARIWGFGYDGDVVFSNGQIVAKTKTALEDESNITLMICMNKVMIRIYFHLFYSVITHIDILEQCILQ